ncbi:recombinase family protein [Streptomyces sp. URMC 123]|uniref:recombinase family protein n=1 Tax=Streptomyces sp. URMC 123 TaxID=3423403 RepID=UPI003F1A8ACB
MPSTVLTSTNLIEEPSREGWSPEELQELAQWKLMQQSLPADAPRGLLSIRLSIFKDETTSPIRQELDLWATAQQKGVRVVGVASDINVSATKVPPWQRKRLGYWINDLAPEFDVILFWKLDRFIRHIYDLHLMIEWSKEFNKNLISKVEELDFSTTLGQMMVTMIAGMARIEAENLGIRLTSLWQYTRTTTKWLIGKPVYGYRTEKSDDPANPHKVLVINPDEARIIRYVYVRRVKHHRSYNYICDILNRAGIRTARGAKWTVASLVRIMRNPALTGVRVISSGKRGGNKPPQIVYSDKTGEPIKVAEAILEPDEFQKLIEADLTITRKKPNRNNKATHYLGSIKCGYCKRNMTAHRGKRKLAKGGYSEHNKVRCINTQLHKCDVRPSVDAKEVYRDLETSVLKQIGDYPVVERVYVQGQDNAKKRKELQESIEFYMKALEPGGKFSVGGFLQKTAEETLVKLSEQLADVPEESAQNRWETKTLEGTYRQRWILGGREKMEEDLLRGGITFEVYTDHFVLAIPEDVKQQLIIKKNYFDESRLKEKVKGQVPALT